MASRGEEGCCGEEEIEVKSFLYVEGARTKLDRAIVGSAQVRMICGFEANKRATKGRRDGGRWEIVREPTIM